MEDSDFLCPLCCEELDISDRNFYPCKCGYQVCMWCWHRIRESESGNCPACRTPYGDDPHEFSAVDVEEVMRVSKEKADAQKKTGPKGEVVEDRTALANMRVIRRNLVYAVGLPPHPDELLRKADYFGQYGKINKIVLNRNNPPAGDARRASASAYVTFFHKVRAVLRCATFVLIVMQVQGVRHCLSTP
jgi:CCR4-NOT transcription complex subunit 4